MVDSEKVVDLQSQVNALKNETLKLKEHLSKARQATNQVSTDLIFFFKINETHHAQMDLNKK